MSKIQFCPSRYLKDKNYGVRVNGTIYVSPAVWDLLLDANDREMRLVMHALRVIDLDSPEARAEWKKKFGKDMDADLCGTSLVDT